MNTNRIKENIMKFTAIFIFLLLAAALSATIHSVSNLPNTDPDFTSLSAAQTYASPGDTLYVYGSGTSYGDFVVTKRLTLIGPGYFLDQNPYTQAFPVDAKLGFLTFNAGSAGSLISGFSIFRIVVNDDNITIIRNRIYYTSTGNSTLNMYSGAINIIIAQNYMHWNNTVDDMDNFIHMTGNNTNIYIANNILITHTATAGRALIYMASTCTAIIENNVMLGREFEIRNAVFQNNIVINGIFIDDGGNVIQNNIGNSNQFGTDDGNQSYVDMSSVFTYSGTTDGYYSLAPGSPAIGAGVGGVDCGCFGGLSPYVLSGMPAGIPSIYEFNAPGSGYIIPVEIKVQSH